MRLEVGDEGVRLGIEKGGGHDLCGATKTRLVRGRCFRVRGMPAWLASG